MAKAKQKQEEKSGFAALSPDNKEWIKSLEKEGWMFSFSPDPGWSASKHFPSDLEGENTTVGPADAFLVIMNLVETMEKKRGGTVPEKVSHDSNGQGFLPEMEPTSVKDLDALIKRRVEAVAAFKAAGKVVEEVNRDVFNAFAKLGQYFEEDVENACHIYNSPAGGFLEISHKTTDKIRAGLEDRD